MISTTRTYEADQSREAYVSPDGVILYEPPLERLRDYNGSHPHY
jgi:hypothetical protein